jgi:hypothetical protein
MRAAVKWLIDRARSPWLAAPLAAFLFACVAFQYTPRTPLGTQCPTAQVQVVKAEIVCCGKVIGYEVRAPQLGEPQFMQCHCAEKKAGGHKLAVPPKLDVYCASVQTVEPKSFTVPSQTILYTRPLHRSVAHVPPVPPPLA